MDEWISSPTSWVLPLLLVVGTDIAMAGVTGLANRFLITAACVLALTAYLLGPRALATATVRAD